MTSTTRDSDPARDDAGRPDVVRLGRAGRAWRTGALLLGVGLALWGTVAANDDKWPFAPMSQFAFRTDPDGVVESTWIEAQTTQGRRVEVPLHSRGVGIGRAEIEGQLRLLIEDPSRLQAVADAWHTLHPDAPQYTRLWLHQTIHPLRGGAAQEPHVVTLAEWAVPR